MQLNWSQTPTASNWPPANKMWIYHTLSGSGIGRGFIFTYNLTRCFFLLLTPVLCPVGSKASCIVCVGLTAPTETFPPGVEKRVMQFTQFERQMWPKMLIPRSSVTGSRHVLTDSHFPGAHSYCELSYFCYSNPLSSLTKASMHRSILGMLH